MKKFNNMSEKEKDYKKAVDILEKSGMNSAQQINVIRLLVTQQKDNHPFTHPIYENGEVKMWQSELDTLSAFGFETEKEVILANAIALNLGENFSPNDFPHQFKAILRILGVESKWAE